MAAGSLTWRMICRRLAPIERMRSIWLGSTERNPPKSPTAMGKNVVTTMGTTLGAMS